MFADVIVAAILLTICVIVVGVIGAICRLLAAYDPKGRGRWEAVTRDPRSIPPHHHRLQPSSSGHESISTEKRIDCGGRKTSPPSTLPPDPHPHESTQRTKVNRSGGPSTATTTTTEVNSAEVEVEVEEGGGGCRSMPLHANSFRDQPSPALPPPAAAAVTAAALLPALPPTDTGLSIGDDETVVDVISGRNLQRALSCDSVMSDTSSAAETADLLLSHSAAAKIGQLEFGLHYDSELSDLVVNVLQAKDLEKNPITGSQDSFVKLWLTPHEDRRQQTKIQKDSVNPQYSERFRFRLESEQLDGSRVQFQVYSCDRYARQKLIGETELRLGDIDIRQPVRVWMNLHEMDQKPADFGDIMFSLAYLPTAERMTVVIAKARNINCPSGRLTVGCFAKVHLLQKGKKVAKKKTSLKHDDRNPIFNEAMTFMVPATSLLTVELRISVLAAPPDKSSDVTVIGHVTVGPKSSGTELVHWTQAMTSLRKPVTMWHSLMRD